LREALGAAPEVRPDRPRDRDARLAADRLAAAVHQRFAPDFTNAIWLAGYQQHAISAHLHPTLFLHTRQIGVFARTSPSLLTRRR
jgi:hypothetical protein